jgi:hypothetical protein
LRPADAPTPAGFVFQPGSKPQHVPGGGNKLATGSAYQTVVGETPPPAAGFLLRILHAECDRANGGGLRPANKRSALEELMMHRERLAADLKGRSGYDFSRPISQVEDEIAMIERGFARLNTAAAA